MRWVPEPQMEQQFLLAGQPGPAPGGHPGSRGPAVLGFTGQPLPAPPHLFPVEEWELQTEALGSTLFLPVLPLLSPRLLLAPASLSFPCSAANGDVPGEREVGRAHPAQTTCVCLRELGELPGCEQPREHTRVHQNPGQQRAKQA